MTHADAAVETQDHELNGYDLTPSQRRVWSLEQIGNSAVAGRPLLELGLSGPLDVTTLRTALDRLALRHPALRLRFRVHPGGRVLQLPDNAAALPLSVCDLSAQTGGDAAHAYQRIRNELAVPDIESGGARAGGAGSPFGARGPSADRAAPDHL